MEKISLSVKIPALGDTFDFIIPDTMSVADAQKLMIRILSAEYSICEKMTGIMLFDMEDGTALRTECSFAQMGIADGAKLIML